MRDRNQSQGVAHYEAKLDNDKVRTIRADEKSSNVELGRRYGVHWSTIRDVRAHKTWKHVEESCT